jgi:Na+-driven multidrug efflux pump
MEYRRCCRGFWCGFSVLVSCGVKYKFLGVMFSFAFLCTSPDNNKLLTDDIRYLGVGGHLFAIATLISQLFNLIFIVIGFVLCTRKDGDKPVLSLHFKKITIRDYLVMIMPILISEFLWSLGQNVESAVYGHLGTSNLAAYVCKCGIVGVYTLLTTEELFRLAVSLIIFRKRKWIISLC